MSWDIKASQGAPYYISHDMDQSTSNSTTRTRWTLKSNDVWDSLNPNPAVVANQARFISQQPPHSGEIAVLGLSDVSQRHVYPEALFACSLNTGSLISTTLHSQRNMEPEWRKPPMHGTQHTHTQNGHAHIPRPRGHSWNSSLIPPHKERQCRLHCKPSQTSFKVPLIIRLRAQSVGLHSSLSPALSDLHQRCQGRCQTGSHVIFDKADFSEHTPTRMKGSQWRSD
ncbi:unnamed protein product [Leuciscus chuanchicus]